MAFQYLAPEDLFDAFNDAKKHMRPLFEPLREFERVARNRPHPAIDKSYPKVTDGTTASVIEKTPRRIFQQMPTGLAKSPQNDWITHVAGFILTTKIIPNATSQYPFMQKCQNVISKALTYGAQPAYIPFVNRGQYYGPDMLLPYIMDVFLEPGKVSDEDSNFILMRAWYQPRDVKAIIATQQKLKAKAAERGETYDGGWDLSALAEIENKISQKDDLATTPAERDKNNRSGGVEIIHAFQRGIGGKFYSFHMGTKQIVRTKTNPDPRGVIPLHYCYAGSDGSNPLGRGFVELVGAMQNLLDSEVQMYQYNRALMLNPPMLKYGEWNENQAKFAPNVLIDLGSNPGAKLEPLRIDSTAISSFPSNYSMMQGQLYQLLNAPTSNVSSSAGNTQMSKTPQGVDQANQNLSIDDNYIRKQAEAWLEKVFETQLNLWFAEHHGIDEMQLDTETADAIRSLQNGAMSAMVSPDNKIRLDYDTEVGELQFIIDPGSSEIQDDQKEIAELKEIVADVNQNPYSIQYIMQAGKQLQLGEVYKQLFQKLGLKELDKILTDLPKDPQTGQPQAPPLMAMDRPKLSAHFESLPPAAQVQFLRNAGIDVSIQDVMQTPIVDPNVRGQAGGAGNITGDAALAAQNPLVQANPTLAALAALKIPFDALPEDAKQHVLQAIGIPTSQLSPTQQGLEMQAIKHSHDILSGMQPPAPMQPGQAGQPGQPGQTPAQPAQPTQPTQPAPATPPEQQPIAPEQNQSQTAPQPQPPQQPANGRDMQAEDQAFAQQLSQMGVPAQMIPQAVAMLNSGMSAEDVLKTIQGALNHG